MPNLTKKEVALIRERIIVTIKRYGEMTSSGHRMDYTDFRPALFKDEIISSNANLKNADFSVKSILTYFSFQNDIRIDFRTESTKHWIQFALKRTIKQAEIEDAGRKVIFEIKAKNGVAPNEPFHIPPKTLAAELSRAIPFFELYLTKNKMSLLDFVKDLGLNKPEADSQQAEEKKGKTQNTNETVGSESVSEVSSEEAETRVREDILRITSQEGMATEGYRQIILGMLCNELAANSDAYQVSRSRYKGPARSYLLDRFGDILVIEYIDGKDWVRIPLSVFGKGETEQKVETPEENAVEEMHSVEEEKPMPSVEEKPKTVKVVGKRKEKATELLIQEMINLNDDELGQLLCIIQLIRSASGDIVIKPAKNGEELTTARKSTASIAAIAESVGLEAQVVLANNSAISKITAYLTTGEIIDIINEEIKMRKGVCDEPTIPNQSVKHTYELKSNYPYFQAALIDTDYEGLDEWLPF